MNMDDLIKFCEQRQRELAKNIKGISEISTVDSDSAKKIINMYSGKDIAYQEVIDEINYRRKK